MSLSRRSRLLLLLVGLPVALVAALLVAAFLPAVQTSVARRALASQGGSVERVALGLGGAELAGFALEQPGLKVDVPALRADAPVIDAARGNIRVLGLVARDIEVEFDPVAYAAASASRPAAEPAPAEPFSGLFASLPVPPGLSVEGIDLSGRVRVAGAQATELSFSIRGGGLRAGNTAAFTLEAQVKAGDDTVAATLKLAPAMDAAGQLTNIGLALDALATSPLLATPARLRAEASATREGEGENYTVQLSDADDVLVKVEQYWSATSARPGTWKIALRQADLAAFLPGSTLPPFTIEGEGQAEVMNPERVALSGRLAVRAERLETLRLPGLEQALPALGVIRLDTDFAVAGSAAEMTVERLRVALAGERPALTIDVTQPVRVGSAAPYFTPSQPNAVLATIALLDVPQAWITPFVPDLTLKGITGSWSLRATDGRIELASTAPLQTGAVRFGPAEAPVAALDAVKLGGLALRQGPTGMEASIDTLTLVAAGKDLAVFSVRASQPAGQPLSAEGRLAVKLAEALAQPALRGSASLTAGEATVTFSATVDAALTARGEVKLAGLRAPGVAEIPDLDLGVEASRASDGSITARLPLLVRAAKGARESDLTLDAQVAPASAAGLAISAKVSSRLLHVGDLQAFAALAPSSAPATPPAKAATEAPSTTATPWAGVAGWLDIALDRVVLATPALELKNIQGKVGLGPEAATLEKLALLLGTGGQVELAGALRRPAGGDYQLSATAAAQDVAVGPLLRLLQGGDPALDGTGRLDVKIQGTGRDPAAAGQASTLTLDLTSRDGRLRALKLDTNRYVRAGGAVAGLAGLAGAFTGNAELSQRANQITALQSLARSLSDLPYGELAVRLQGGAEGPVKVERLALVSPQLRLEGAGGLDFSPGLAWADRPLALNLELGARGDFAALLETLRVLRPASEASDDYRALIEPLVLDGTPRQVGTDQITRVFTRALGL